MTAVAVEARKISAFMRRDALVMLSYRTAFVGDIASVAVQAAIFGFVAKIIDPSQLPSYGGSRASYFEFVMVGVLITTVSGLLLQRVSSAVRQEQMVGTFEALLVTPTAAATVQIGSVAFDLLLIPIRMSVLLLAVTLAFGLHYDSSGLLPAAALMAAFVPCVWGLGLVAAAAIVTFRRGAGLIGILMGFLGLASGAFFPLAVLPHWLQGLTEANPVAIVMEGTRSALIGGGDWSVVSSDLLILVPVAASAMLAGLMAFRAALAREHRNGTLGLY
jgi:ABC-2 type transport system permease protein